MTGERDDAKTPSPQPSPQGGREFGGPLSPGDQIASGKLIGALAGALYGFRYTDMCAFRAIRRDSLLALGWTRSPRSCRWPKPSDGAHAYRAFASRASLAHVALNLSAGEHSWGIYHIQNVNNYGSRLKGVGDTRYVRFP